MKKILLILSLSAIFLFTACKKEEKVQLSSSEKKSITENGEEDTLKLGFDQAFPPMGFKDDGGEFVGFDIDLAKEVTKKLNMKLELIPISWDAKDAELESGNINCIWNGFTMTGRENNYTFSDPYMKNSQVIVVKDNSKISKLDDLKGLTLEVQSDSTGENTLNSEEKKDFKNSLGNVISVSDYMTALSDLESGGCDAVLIDEVLVRYNIQNGKKIKVLDDNLSDEEYAIGFKKGNNELRDKIQKGLDELKENGKIEEISKKWFGKDISE